MTVLARDLDAYKRAVEAYNRQVRSYNVGVDNYKQTIAMDPNGNALVRDPNGNVYAVGPDGKLSNYALPDGQSIADFGSTPVNGDDYYQWLRQNPTSRNTQSISGVRQQVGDGGAVSYYIPNSEGGGQPLGPEYRVVSRQFSGGGDSADYTYTAERDASTYAEQPGAFNGLLRAQRPDPTGAQMRRMSAPGLAQQERGLLGDVIRGNGIQDSGVQYRGGLARTSSARSAPVVTQQPPQQQPPQQAVFGGTPTGSAPPQQDYTPPPQEEPPQAVFGGTPTLSPINERKSDFLRLGLA